MSGLVDGSACKGSESACTGQQILDKSLRGQVQAESVLVGHESAFRGREIDKRCRESACGLYQYLTVLIKCF